MPLDDNSSDEYPGEPESLQLGLNYEEELRTDEQGGVDDAVLLQESNEKMESVNNEQVLVAEDQLILDTVQANIVQPA